VSLPDFSHKQYHGLTRLSSDVQLGEG